MVESGAGWSSGGSLESRFFIDNGLWKDAPLLTGQTVFEPLPDVRNIMVTGGEGFIASWLVRHLVTKYPDAYNIVCFDKLDYCSSLNNSRMLEGRANFKFFHGDLTKDADVLKCLRTHKIDTVFHLAAQSHVDLSFGNSYSFTYNNVIGTHVLLECVKAVGTIKRFFHISTDEVYGEVQMDAADLSEHTVLAPTNPYSASKAAAEMYITAYVSSFQLPAIMIRLNNVYGPHQFPEKIIPKFINLLQRKKPLWIHGDGHNTRRYLYAGDAADAFDTILHKGGIGQIYNVDSRDEISNLDLAGKLLNRFGVTDIAGSIEHTRDRPFNDLRYAVDGAKLRELGWEPRVSFEQGLTNTVEWYAKYSDWWGPIENILTPFPVVQSKGEGEDEGDAMPENGGASGKPSEPGRGQQAGSGAEHYYRTLGNEAEKLASARKGANGLLGRDNGVQALVASDGARKRKADVMDEV